MNSIFDNNLWYKKDCFVTPQEDFIHHGVDPDGMDIGRTCIVIFSSGLFERVLGRVAEVDDSFTWPYHTTPLKRCFTARGTCFSLHFPSYGSTRIANSLEQLKACGVQRVLALGLCGTPQEEICIGDVLVLEGALRGDGVSRYYAPAEYPAVADHALTSRVAQGLESAGIPYRMGLSFGTDALYREESGLVDCLRELKVVAVDLESSAYLAVGRRLDLACSWVGVVSDRLVQKGHEGNIHSEHIVETLMQVAGVLLERVDAEGR